MSEPESAALLALVQGLRKAVADPGAEWVDANVVRLLLDRYDNRDSAVDEAFAAAGRVPVPDACVCGHGPQHHNKRSSVYAGLMADYKVIWGCGWTGCGCPNYVLAQGESRG